MKELLQSLSTNDIRNNPDFFQVKSSYEGINHVANELSGQVVGQPQALGAIARGIIRAESGMSPKDKPLSTFLFLGPTGVGKTESAKALAKYLHPQGEEWKENFLRIDCAEFKQDHDVHRITGSPNSYVGYGDPILISPDFAERKNSVLLIDEIDQASAGFHDWLYSVLDEGEFRARVGSETNGRNSHAEETVISLRNSFIILTSNVGASEMQDARRGKKGIGFGATTKQGDISEAGMKALEERFKSKPAMLGRIDAIVPFNELEPKHYDMIFNKYMDEINHEQSYGWNYIASSIELREELLSRAVGEGQYGGRDIRRTIDKYILSKVAELKWEGSLEEGQPIIGDLEDGQVIFWTSGLRLDDPRKQQEGPHVTSPKKKNEHRNTKAGSTIGNRPDEPPTRKLGKQRKRIITQLAAIAEVPTGRTIDIYVSIQDGENETERGMVFNVPLSGVYE